MFTPSTDLHVKVGTDLRAVRKTGALGDRALPGNRKDE
ncbi:hypothetical protein L21SP4_00300 [Kiritimatiella glycovorans]|uniref:Uncharacterized protein n=1 Tax=Kiritimatiella glycovorans TaxID=1307763 RepID=A0A0G3EAS1_9BACT|nr:hypothetical protein L21SP4_00300 [Kiritimatiella glycovorans]